ncbi:hypothetical protein [Mucilaginibacter paludis]|uniref:Uncharacterized protein n=1 Tax=Mucilaginibacter paludis DSM 18603 TaxID=714943 RepID=H1YD09_9SPHI|nr:hypothetical protein [Mucilaginibacter paludis]EHQ26066.1 hypothetical protein Mucpa_1919 [Mucilaginibacter paludis DSM 18603]
MITINQESWNEKDGELSNRENDETLIHSNRVESDRPEGISEGVYNTDTDEDDQNLSDDDVNGRDLDTDNSDEWDEGDANDPDLEEDDLADNDQAAADLHQVKNDQFGSLASSVQNGPDPNEIPEEGESGNGELDYPDDGGMEQANDDEVEYEENNEVEQPSETEAPDTKAATLGNLDSTFTDQSHGRTTGRMIDHEPGSNGVDGPYNL